MLLHAILQLKVPPAVGLNLKYIVVVETLPLLGVNETELPKPDDELVETSKFDGAVISNAALKLVPETVKF